MIYDLKDNDFYAVTITFELSILKLNFIIFELEITYDCLNSKTKMK